MHLYKAHSTDHVPELIYVLVKIGYAAEEGCLDCLHIPKLTIRCAWSMAMCLDISNNKEHLCIDSQKHATEVLFR